MGTGKTTVGRQLAEKLGWPFIDLDSRIEAKAGKTITVIFSEEGEATFRQLEKDLLQEALQQEPAVIATGGGAILDPASRAQMKAAGLVVALSAPSEIIYQRIKHLRTRPLLQGSDPRAEIQRLIELRQPFYEEANHVFDSSRQESDQLAERIAQLVTS